MTTRPNPFVDETSIWQVFHSAEKYIHGAVQHRSRPFGTKDAAVKYAAKLFRAGMPSVLVERFDQHRDLSIGITVWHNGK